MLRRHEQRAEAKLTVLLRKSHQFDSIIARERLERDAAAVCPRPRFLLVAVQRVVIGRAAAC